MQLRYTDDPDNEPIIGEKPYYQEQNGDKGVRSIVIGKPKTLEVSWAIAARIRGTSPEIISSQKVRLANKIWLDLKREGVSYGNKSEQLATCTEAEQRTITFDDVLKMIKEIDIYGN